jgi:hypothetical protein
MVWKRAVSNFFPSYNILGIYKDALTKLYYRVSDDFVEKELERV